MKRSMSYRSAPRARLMSAAVRRIADWWFPLMLAVAWTITAAYTLAILIGDPSQVQPGKTTASSPEPLAAVHSIAARQPKSGGS
jgi:hypothetical protein